MGLEVANGHLKIKLNDNNQFEKSWIGNAMNFEKHTGQEDRVYFDVSDSEEYECPEEFRSYSLGWYLNNPEFSLPLQPLFFDNMKNCDWMQFEEYCFYLLVC